MKAKESNNWLNKYNVGGSIPGTVGFTYGRTGDIPSNGKHAKKTLASAADGMPIIPKNDPIKTYYENYLNSPKFSERGKESGYDVKQLVEDRLGALNNQHAEYWETPYSPISSRAEKLSGITKSRSNAESPGRVIINYSQADQLGAVPSEIAAHEYSHKLGSSDESLTGDTPKRSLLNQNDLKELETRNIFMQKLLGKQPWTPEFSNNDKNYTHDTSGYESKSDIDALRFMMNRDKVYNAGTQDFTNEHLNQAKDLYKNDFIFNRLQKSYSDEDLKYLMNKIATNKQSSIPSDMMKDGGELKKLNDLTNWTNYNKPSDNKWLEKYSTK
jgi:hypothetical protein